MSFKEYIMSQTPGDDPRGDFIRDARQAARTGIPPLRRFTDGIDSLESLKAYLERCGACPGAVSAGVKLWREYQRTQH